MEKIPNEAEDDVGDESAGAAKVVEDQVGEVDGGHGDGPVDAEGQLYRRSDTSNCKISYFIGNRRD